MRQSFFDQVDRAIVWFMSAYGMMLLRMALGGVFIWFGLLKVLGVSPVEDLVAQTVYWLDPGFFVPFLGVWELLVGLGLFFRVFLRTVLLFFFLQMAGTFGVLLFHPEIAFQGRNPFLLTTLGEFVVKNLVLISAGFIIGSTVREK